VFSKLLELIDACVVGSIRGHLPLCNISNSYIKHNNVSNSCLEFHMDGQL
jgi:hypothetical protein